MVFSFLSVSPPLVQVRMGKSVAKMDTLPTLGQTLHQTCLSSQWNPHKCYASLQENEAQ